MRFADPTAQGMFAQQCGAVPTTEEALGLLAAKAPKLVAEMSAEERQAALLGAWRCGAAAGRPGGPASYCAATACRRCAGAAVPPAACSGQPAKAQPHPCLLRAGHLCYMAYYESQGMTAEEYVRDAVAALIWDARSNDLEAFGLLQEPPEAAPEAPEAPEAPADKPAGDKKPQGQEGGKRDEGKKEEPEPPKPAAPSPKPKPEPKPGALCCRCPQHRRYLGA